MTTAQKNKMAKCKEAGFNKYRYVGLTDIACYHIDGGKVENVRIFGQNGVQKNLDTYSYVYEYDYKGFKPAKDL